ncbi:MAG: BMC domain-containing protein [Anaerolineae bacterium]|nr:BMC domain-containing protein [Anaerolineae bacterium]
MSSKALGLIETIGLAAAIEAADAASKSANVILLGYENSRGGGMITVKFVGDVGAVRAAVSAGTVAAQRVGKVAASHIIPRPHAEIEALIEAYTRGQKLQADEPETESEPAPKPKKTRRTAKSKSTTSEPETPADASPAEEDAPPAE